MSILSTLQLLGVVKKVPSFEAFFLHMFFPQVVTFATKEIAFDKLVEDLDLAPLVSPVVAGKVQKEKGGVFKTFAPAYLKPKNIVEPGRLLKRNAGEAVGGELTPDQRRLAVVTDLLIEHDKKITRREEWMAVQAVLTGQITAEMEGESGEYSIDFGRDAANNVTLVGAAAWTALNKETSNKPVEDIESWADQCSGSADIVVMDKLAWSEFRQFECVKELLDTKRGSSSMAELGPDTRKVAQYKGTIGTVEIWVYKGKYTEGGVEKNYMPDHTVLVGPSGYAGVLAYGGIQDAKANANGIVEATRYPKNWYTEDPSAEYLMTQAAPLPVTPDADAFVVATVG